MCLPRAQANKIVDSLRILPAVRQLLQAERAVTAAQAGSAQVQTERVARLASEAADAQARQTQLQERATAAEAQASDWRTKARRRWWVNLGLAAALSGVLYLTVAH